MADDKNAKTDFSLTDDTEVHWNPDAPVMWVDGAKSLAAANDGTVRFNLIQNLIVGGTVGAKEPIIRRVCAQLIMTPAQAISIANWLLQNVKVSPDVVGDK